MQPGSRWSKVVLVAFIAPPLGIPQKDPKRSNILKGNHMKPYETMNIF